MWFFVTFLFMFFFPYESQDNWWIHWLVYYMQIVITMYVHCEVRHNMNFSHCFFKLLLLQFLIPNTYSLLACFFKLLLHFSISQLVSYEKKFKFIFEVWEINNISNTHKSLKVITCLQTFMSSIWFESFVSCFWICLIFFLGSYFNNGRVFWFIFLRVWWSPNIM
jgi:hypothetical protein